MNYLKIYNDFIYSRKHNKVDYSNVYTEIHHILPKAQTLYPQFSNLNVYKWNAIELTRQEHLFAHKLLAKLYGGRMISVLSLLKISSTRLKWSPFETKEKLFELYYKKHIRKFEIIKLYNIDNNNTLNKTFKKYNFIYPFSKIPKISYNTFLKISKTGMSAEKISKELGISFCEVIKLKKIYNIKFKELIDKDKLFRYLYVLHLSKKEIAELENVTVPSVSHNIKVYDFGKKFSKIPDIDIKTLQDDIRNMTRMQVAKKHNTTITKIEYMLEKYGIRKRL